MLMLILMLTLVVQVSKASQLQSVVQSLPSLEDLTVWTALEEAKVRPALPGTS